MHPQFRTAPDTTPSPLGDRLTDSLQYQRIVFLGEEVTDTLATRICSQLLILTAENPNADITMLINSPGGSVSAGLAIFDLMELIPNDVSTVAMGNAASMGQFLLSAGTAGKRFALPRARILMHQGSAGLQGTAIDIAIQAENLDHTKHVMLSLIAQHTGQDYNKIVQDSERDRWFTAQEALDYGFVDGVPETLAEVIGGSTRIAAGLGGSR